MIKCYNIKREEDAKDRLATSYNQAFLTANFINTAMNGGSLPSLSDLYPNIFPKQISDEEIQKERDARAMALYKEQMIDFANAHNKKRKTEGGENN